ncbi:MAG: Gldg family protein [Candidatus Desulfatibia sp.]|uniref:GldG family protein n=1 Tax=Candidatus Desulfatibia sp. TaxID=3101189 RepID=UPI002F301A5D
MGLKNISAKYIKFLAYLLVIILVNLAGITLFFRIDLTENKIYSISNASKRVVSTLSEPLTINVFFTRNLPAPHNSTEQYLKDLLKEYATYANRYFNYRFYDVSPDEGDISRGTMENRELANNYGIHPVQIQAFEKDEIKFQTAYMGLVLIHGDVIERIPTITSTDGLEYKLTNAILKLNNKVSALLSLPEKIRIKLFLSSSLEQVAPYMGLNPLTEIPAKIERIVKRLNNKHYGQLQFEYLDPSTDQNLKKESEKYNLVSLSWPALSGKIKQGKGVIGLVMEYKDKSVHIPLLRVFKIPIIGTQYQLTDINQMEEIINESLESLIDINENIGLLASHGTLDVEGSFQTGPTRPGDSDQVNNFRELISENYTIKAVNLKEGNIPKGLDCLVIARPTETFSDYELLQIDQFLMQGKSLAVFLDAFNEVMPPSPQGMAFRGQNPRYVPLKTGLEKLLAHYGVSIRKSYVMDESSFKQRTPARFGGGERPIYFAPVIKNRNINHDLEFMKNIKGLIALKISPLDLDTQRIKENGLAAHRLFSSSEKSWEMSGQINLHPMFIQPPKLADDMQSLPLAYIIEGEFPSYFDGKPIPEKTLAKGDVKESDAQKEPDKKPDVDLSKIKGEGEFLSQGKPGKIFLMASSDMLKDNILDPKGRNPNTMFIMNLLDYLNNREDIAVMRSKEQRFNPLADTGPGIKTVIKSFNIAGLPVLVVLFGLTVWFRRHSRKKHIRMMFQK